MQIQESPYKKKTVDEGKLYKRVHGTTVVCTDGANTIDFDITYSHVKITELEIMWAPEGVTVDLLILDDDSGTYSTIPNYLLNQFAFNANVAKDTYRHHSTYDADLYIGMTISVVLYLPVGTAKTIGINFGLDEVKT